MLLTGDRICFENSTEPEPGFLEIVGDTIINAAPGVAPRMADEHLTHIVAPGFVDVHCHGGGGGSFDDIDVDSMRTAIATHRKVGTTTLVASVVTQPLAHMCDQIERLANLVECGELAGIHLEGPWLSPRYRGAHPADLLLPATRLSVEAVMAAGRGNIRLVTIAPEVDGALEATAFLAAHDVLVAIGHTDADFDRCRAAIEAGARGATHLFNGMAPMHHRDPGPVLALWGDERIHVEVVADGIHIRPELISFLFRTVGDRVVLVTDAMAAAGAGDGRYRLGTQNVIVSAGVARIAGTDTIAGSTLTLDQAIRTAVDSGVSIPKAVRAATATAADYVGLSRVGRLAPGHRADVVLLDDELTVTDVMIGGRWQGNRL